MVMRDIFNFLWEQGAHMFFWNEGQLINRFFMINVFIKAGVSARMA